MFQSLGGALGLEQLFADVQRRGDLGATALVQMIEGLFIHFGGGGVMHDVAAMDITVVGLQPGVDQNAVMRTKRFSRSPIEPETSII